MTKFHYFKFDDKTDSDFELDIRMEGITGGIRDDAVVIFQYPSMVSDRYDAKLVEHLKNKKGMKLVIFAQDLGCSVSSATYELQNEIKILSRADLLILESPKMKKIMNANGLTDIDVIYHEVWDYPCDIAKDTRAINIEKTVTDLEIGDMSIDTLITRKACGFVMVDSGDYIHSRKLGYCVASGIPVVVGNDSIEREFVRKFGIGICADTKEEAKNIVMQMTEHDIQKIKVAIEKLSVAVGEGVFTKTLLQKVLYHVVLSQLEN